MEHSAQKKLFILFCSIFLFFVFNGRANAQSTSEGVGVAAEVVLLEEQEIAIKGISGIIASPSPVRVGYVVKITVTLKGFDGMLLPFHSVRIEAEGPGDFYITQPAGLTGYDGISTAYITSDVAGVYVVSAYDTTYSEKDIKINDDADAIFLAEGVPLLYSEPEFTQGYSNTLDWEPLDNIVQYYIEASDDPNFKTIVFNSGWINETEYEFTGLQDSKEYFYRVKGRNGAGANTVWSNTVYSTQDASPPTSQVTEVDKLQNGFRVYLDFKDDVGEVVLVDIYLKMDDGKWILVKSTEVNTVNIDFSEIEGFDPDNKPERVCFYSRAEDSVGNLEVVNPGQTGDFCVGYGLTFQNVVDLVTDQSYKLLLILKDLFDSGLEYLTEIIENNLMLFRIILIISLIAYWLIKIYDTKFSVFKLSKWLELWNLQVFPWLVADEDRENIGVVYDSFTHEPVENAVVELLYKSDVVQSSLTDQFGIFRFVPDDRKFTIVVWKPGYKFPSAESSSSKDEVYNVIYKGDTIVLDGQRDKLIGIPIDKIERSADVLILYWTLDFLVGLLKYLYPIIFICSISISFILYSLSLNLLYIIIACLNIYYFLDNLGLFGRKKIHWGVIIGEDKKPISGIKLGLYSQKFDKLLDFRITDEKGKYRFLVPSGKYYLKIVDKGIETDGNLVIDFERGRTIEIVTKILVRRA